MTPLLTAIGDVLARLSPYLLLGFGIAGLLHAFVPSRWLATAMGGAGWRPVVAGAVVGIPLPLCSCGVVPVAVELRKRGAGRGATASFLVATPETGVDSIATSIAVLHPLMVVFRPLAALVTAVVTGLTLERTTAPPTEPAEESGGSCCGHGKEADEGEAKGLFGGLRYAFVDLFGEVATYLIPAILITAALTVWVEVPASVSETISSPFVQMLVLLVAGIPIYVCATAATPVAAALIVGGFSPGAALVFLLAGPATNLMTLSAVANLLGRRAAVVYCVSIAVVSLAFGVGLDALYRALSISSTQSTAHFHDHGGWLGWACAAVVGVLTLWHLIRRLRRKPA